ncbi:hypothetical protein [Actinoallomurus sp. NPDC050550]|uniref:hypothetical protein n=1 Tax=Actinoallomurus sp. NPDC050550 TaxID=3154937 RepID=UPI0034063CCC
MTLVETGTRALIGAVFGPIGSEPGHARRLVRLLTDDMLVLADRGFDRTGVPCDQVIMLHDGRLVQASKLRAGDRLVDKDGKPVEIRTLSSGESDGGICHITTAAGDSSGAEHLIVVGGIVAGGFYLQTVFGSLPDEYKVDDLDDRPHLWETV